MSNSSRRYATPLTIELAQPGLLAAAIVLAVHGLAGIALLLSSLPVALRGAGLALVAASAHLVMFRLRCFRTLVWRADGAWLLVTRGGQTMLARLSPDSVALPFVALLNFDGAGGKHFSVVVFPTAANGEALRKLRVRLRVDGCGA